MTISHPGLRQRVIAEAVGTAFLLMGIVGSGIMAQRLSPNDVGLQLLQNALATAGVLAALILALGPVSGAHFNPVVTLAAHSFGGRQIRDTVAYLIAQFIGAFVGVMLANAMFDVSAAWATNERNGSGVYLGEVIATVGLIMVIFSVVRSGNSHQAAAGVATYIGAAYYFTSSTSFANPAVTFGRMFSDTFAGIRPTDAPAFVAAQLLGLGLAIVLVRQLYPSASSD